MSFKVLVVVWWTWNVLCWGDRLSAGFADVLRHSPSFWKRHAQAQFPFQLSGRRRVSSWQKIYSPGFIIGVKRVVECRRVRRLPTVKGADVHRGRQYRRRFWRLRRLRAVVVVIAILCMIYHRHCCQVVEWIGRQVQVIQARWNDWELPSESVRHCGLIRVVMDC